MQQRTKSLIARQYYKNKYGTQLIEDDGFLDVQVGDDNQLQTRQAPTIVIDSEDEAKQPRQVKEAVVKQDQIVQKNEERNSVSQLQNLLTENLRPSQQQMIQTNKINNALDSMSQLQKSLSSMKIQQQNTQPTQPIYQPPAQPIKQTQQPVQKKQRVINIPDIQTKMNIESDEEEPTINKAPRKQVRTNEEETLPSIQFKKKPDYFTQLKQRIVAPLDDKTALQISYHIKPRDEEQPQTQTTQEFAPVSYQDFIAMKNREVNAAKQQRQEEEYRKKLLQDKKQDKVAPEKIREGETFQQYQQRMVQYIQKVNKYKNKKKFKKGTDWENQKTAEEKQKINELIKIINPEFQAEEEEKPQKPDLLNYDVLFKNGLILKQAFVKPPEPDINPMINVYKKGRYATEFIFNGGIDLEDGPYGQASKKKPKKLPFPKHRLSLSPWEYYGVGPEEYFATKNPNFEFKQKYVPVKDYYNEMPRPKQNPKYYSYDVDQLLSKRYQDKSEEYQYQTSFIGYKQKHWTPVSHLKAMCPNLVMEYEKYERERLFGYIANAKLSKVQLVPDVCILSAKFTKQKIENTIMSYWKKTTGGPQVKKTISNLERQVADDQPKQMDEMELFTKEDDEEEKERKRKISKEQKHLEDEWDPSKDDTARAQRNKLRKEKFMKIAEELKLKDNSKKGKEKKVKIQTENNDQQNPDGQEQNKKTKKKAKREKKQKNIENKVQAEIEANQFEEQFQRQKQDENMDDCNDKPEEEIYEEPEDIAYRAKLKEWNTKRLNLTGTEVDMQESLKLIYPSAQQPKLDPERYKIFMPK